MTYPIHRAKAHLSRLIEQALAGEEIVIARGEVPVVRLVALSAPAKPRRQPGTLKGKVALTEAFFEPLPPDELAAWGEEP